MALAVFGSLAGLALLVLYVPPVFVAWTALGLTAFGFVFGVPTGLYYHVVLRRELLKLGPLPTRWYLHPHRLHDQLDDAALRRVTRWFFMGGFGFVLIVAGFALALVALLTFR